MSEKKPKAKEEIRAPRPKKKLGLSVPPPLRLPHEDLIKAEPISPEIDQSQDQPTTQPQSSPATEEPRYDSPATESPGHRVTRLQSSPATKSPHQSVAQLRSSRDPGYHVPNWLDDEVMPKLHLSEQVLLRRLYRLSYGFNRQTTDSVSIPKLAEKCNLSEAGVKKAIRSLEEKGLISVYRDLSGNPGGGNRYTVLTQLLSNPATQQPGQLVAQQDSNPINDHEDLKRTRDHQSETMRIYQTLTGNSWAKADQTAYQKIKAVSLNQIETAIRRALSRAASQPGSLAYFVKEILTPSQSKTTTRQRAQLQRIIEQVREAHVGAGYTLDQFQRDVERACGREGVIFDLDLFNEIVGSK